MKKHPYLKGLISIQHERRSLRSTMVNTRPRANRENKIKEAEFDRFANVDDNISFADPYSGKYLRENFEAATRSLEREHEK